jgi:hypothetical protein
MNAKVPAKIRSKLHREHEKFFSELDSILKKYVTGLKPAAVTIKDCRSSIRG